MPFLNISAVIMLVFANGPVSTTNLPAAGHAPRANNTTSTNNTIFISNGDIYVSRVFVLFRFHVSLRTIRKTKIFCSQSAENYLTA
jgi:hypothetical protein